MVIKAEQVRHGNERPATGAKHALDLAHLQQPARVRQVLEAARKVVDRPIPHQYGPRRAGDPPVLIASNDRARELLDWQPARGSLDEMIGSAWRLLEASQKE